VEVAITQQLLQTYLLKWNTGTSAISHNYGAIPAKRPMTTPIPSYRSNDLTLHRRGPDGAL